MPFSPVSVSTRDIRILSPKLAHPQGIDGLLNQLGKAKCFSTLELASGYWQISVDLPLQEIWHLSPPTAWVLHLGYATPPGAFQHLMKHVIRGQNGRRWTTSTLYQLQTCEFHHQGWHLPTPKGSMTLINLAKQNVSQHLTWRQVIGKSQCTHS